MTSPRTLAPVLLLTTFSVLARPSETITLASGAFGTEAQYLREELDRFERATGTHVDMISVPPSSNAQFGQYSLSPLYLREQPLQPREVLTIVTAEKMNKTG